MVLESLVNPLKAERKPWEVFFLGLIYSSVAIGISLLVFPKQASMLMVFLTVGASIPLLYNIIKFEEKKDTIFKSEKKLLSEHKKAIEVFVALFLGFFISFSFWYLFSPSDWLPMLFSAQTETIKAVNSAVTGSAISAISTSMRIFTHNLQVLVICFAFSFLYGAGAIFILTWNASVGGAFIGNFMRSRIPEGPNLLNYFHIASLGLLRYLPHGVLEMGAYFVGGLAGGIISVAVIRHQFFSDDFERIVFDSSDLVLIAVGILFVAAIVEVFVTPGLVALFS